MPHAEVVRLATASDGLQADLWRQALEAEGIRCRVVGADVGIIGDLVFGQLGGAIQPEVWVLRPDADRARQILTRLVEGGLGGTRSHHR
jgi:hypothetical protein